MTSKSGKDAVVADPSDRFIFSNHMKPKYDFITELTWVRLLAVHRIFPALKNLPDAFHEPTDVPVPSGGRGPGGTGGATTTAAVREQRWRDWFTQGGTAPIPYLEKEPAMHPMAKFAVSLCARPDRATSALLAFVAEIFGTDFPDPFAPVDVPPLLVQADAQTPVSLPVLLVHHATVAPARVTAVVAAALRICREAKMKADAASTGSTAAKRTGASAKPGSSIPAAALFVRHACQPTSALSQAVSDAARAGGWLLVEAAHLCSTEKIAAILRATSAITASATSTPSRVILCLQAARDDAGAMPSSPAVRILSETASPRIALGQDRGIRSTMQRHYRECIHDGILAKVVNQCPRHGSSLLFLISYVCAVVDQRCRFDSDGFSDSAHMHRSDADVASAVSLLLSCLEKRPSRQGATQSRGASEALASASTALPWDELRESMTAILGASLQDASSQAVVRAYVDVLLHPTVLDDVNSGRLSSIGGVLRFPVDGSRAAHEAAMDSLPPTDSTEVLGIHPDAERKTQQRFAAGIVTLLERTMAATDANGVVSDVVVRAAAERALSLIPQWPMATYLPSAWPEGSRSAMTDFWKAEVQRHRALSARVIGDVLLALAGSSSDVALCLATGRTPTSWQNATGWHQATLLTWLESFGAHSRHVTEHANVALADTPRRSVIVRLGGLLDPASFVLAFLQDSAGGDPALADGPLEAKLIVPGSDVTRGGATPVSRPSSSAAQRGGGSRPASPNSRPSSPRGPAPPPLVFIDGLSMQGGMLSGAGKLVDAADRNVFDRADAPALSPSSAAKVIDAPMVDDSGDADEGPAADSAAVSGAVAVAANSGCLPRLQLVAERCPPPHVSGSKVSSSQPSLQQQHQQAVVEASKRHVVCNHVRPLSASSGVGTAPVRTSLVRPSSRLGQRIHAARAALPNRDGQSGSRSESPTSPRVAAEIEAAQAFVQPMAQVPVYRSARRLPDDFVLSAVIPSDAEHNLWLLRGTAVVA